MNYSNEIWLVGNFVQCRKRDVRAEILLQFEREVESHPIMN